MARKKGIKKATSKRSTSKKGTDSKLSKLKGGLKNYMMKKMNKNS